ncbi:MAG: autotransporter outer membrane beta-barrel domain-containing protein, partial [Comamonas sp.]
GHLGGGDGTGGAVVAALGGSIQTGGLLSAGAVLQSVGGGGGVSLVRASNAVLGGTANRAPSTVTLTNTANIETSGGASPGLVAQSVASGGLATSTSTATLGGSPSGSDGSSVTLCTISSGCTAATGSGAAITTTGDASIGLLAQSIGGGGGAVLASGNAVTATYKEGTGLGGKLLSAQNINVNTSGGGAAGQLFQSIGGGGAVVSAYSSTSNSSYASSMGGSGKGSNGGEVSVYTYDLPTVTTGVNAPGLVVQSIGSGGGYYSATNLAANSAMGTSFTLGSNTGAGAANNVTAVLGTRGVATPFSTAGANSPGVVVQSIGGGGGISLMASTATTASGTISGQLGQTGGNGNSNAVNLSGYTTVNTTGQQSPGVVVQSITNGGGMAAVAGYDGNLFSGTVRLGSTGGDNNPTGPASANLSGGSITTTGAQSPALILQDIAGGGGLSMVRATNVTLGGLTNSSPYSSNTQASATVTNGASINTSGVGSIGIVAQSIAGGGGLAYGATGKSTLGGAPSGSNGQAVAVTSNASITTSGDNAFGILAQSVGGGGGAVITNTASNTGTFGNGVGHAGAVTVNVNAAIITSGAGAHGVVAQSVAGGGGLVTNGTTTVFGGGTRGNSGVVKVVVGSGGSIKTLATGTVGIKAMSSTDPVFEIAAGASVIGGAGGAALESEGPINELHNSGSVSTADGVAGMAMRTLSGSTTIANSGTLTGNLKLAEEGQNLVSNLSGGTLHAGASLDLGSNGVLRNEGLLQSSATTTTVVGSLVQSATGVLELRVDHAKAAIDALEVSGTAQLAGTLRPTLVNTGLIAPGTVALGRFLSAAGGADATGLSLPRTAIMAFALQRNGDDLALESTADFAPAGLNAEGVKLGQLIGRAQASGLPHFQALTSTLVSIPTVKQLGHSYWNVSGAAASVTTVAAARMATDFTRVMLRRPGSGLASAAGQADDVWADRRNSTWAEIYGDSSRTQVDETIASADQYVRNRGLAIGTERRVTHDTTVGFALGSGVSRFTLGDSFKGRNNVLQLGAYGKREFGPAYAAASVSYSTHSMTTLRSLELLQSAYVATLRARSLAARAEAGYRFDRGVWQLTPYAALQTQNVVTPTYGETARGNMAAPLALEYQRRSVTLTRTELGLAFNRQFALAAGKSLALRTAAAWAHDHVNNQDVPASFQTLQGSSFKGRSLAPVSDLALLSGALALRLPIGISLGLNIQGELGHRSRALAGQVSMRYQW